MTERSGINMLEELLKEVKRLNKKVDVLDRLVKQVANSAKISEIATMVLDTPLKNWAMPVVKPKASSTVKAVGKNDIEKSGSPTSSGLRFKFEPTDASKLKQDVPNRSSRNLPTAPTMCMCEGKMVASNKGKSVPLPNVNISIYDAKDALVKRTKTNRAGTWMSKLPPGRYVALCEGKFQGKDLYPVNINFEVKQGIKRLDVS